MLNTSYFYFFNFMFLIKKKSKLSYNLLLLSTNKASCSLLHMQNHNSFFINNLFIYKKNLFQSFFSYCFFFKNYYSKFYFRAQYHLIGLTFSMGLDRLTTANHNFFNFIVRMNQAHYTLFRLPSSVKNCLIERKGWLLRFSCQNRSDFYYIVKHLHSLRSLFPYKIKGFLFFSELPYQERNIYSGKQERKSVGSSDKSKKTKASSSQSGDKYKKGRKI